MSDALFKIGVYVNYFGKWPEWIELYFETLRRNPTIDFHVFSDCMIPELDAPNIFFHSISFDDYLKFARVKLEVEINAHNGFKFCDLRPFLGYIHQDIFAKYDFYGYADSDLLFGDIRSFYTSEILKKYDVISSHSNRISGHFALFRNTRRNRLMFRKIYNWKKALENPDFVGIDEHGITNAYTMTIFDKVNEKFNLNIENIFTRFFRTLKKKRLYLVEQFTTPFSTITWLDGSKFSQHPSSWFNNPEEFHVKNIIQHKGEKGARHEVIGWEPNDGFLKEIAVADGVFLALRKINGVSFDERIPGFHGYDLAISLIYKGQGYSVLATNKILIEHFSTGDLDKSWIRAMFVISRLYKDHLPLLLQKVSSLKNLELEKLKWFVHGASDMNEKGIAFNCFIRLFFKQPFSLENIVLVKRLLFK